MLFQVLSMLLFKLLVYFIISELTPFQAFPFMQLHPFLYFLITLLQYTFPHVLFLPSWFFFFFLRRFSFGLIFYFEVQFNFSFCFLAPVWKSSDVSFIHFNALSFWLTSLLPFFTEEGHLKLSFFHRSFVWKACNCFDSFAFFARSPFVYRIFSKDNIELGFKMLTYFLNFFFISFFQSRNIICTLFCFLYFFPSFHFFLL